MSDTNHIEVIKEILSDQLGCEPDEVKPETRLRDLGADSLDDIELVMAFEDAYDIEISDEDAEKIDTVGDILKYLEAHT